MNISITTSFIVGGLLLLSILQMNFTVSNNSVQTTLQMQAKHNLQAISQTITADLQRAGYGVEGSKVEDVLNTIKEDEISFESDIDDDGSVETISWEFKDNSKYYSSSSKNPNVYQLVRTGPMVKGGSDNVTTTYPAASFKITYFTTTHQKTTTLSEVDQISIEIVTESSEALPQNNGNSKYARSFWQRTIVPPSLHMRQLQS